ncbi:MAG: ATP-binding protein [Acidobacteriota bacterium]
MNRLAICLFLALLLPAGIAGQVSAQTVDSVTPAAKRLPRVLVLHSFNQGNFRTDGLSRGIADQFLRSGLNIQTSTEYLDLPLLGHTPQYPAFLDGKRAAIKALLDAGPVDAVLLTDHMAMNFWAANSAGLGPEIPVVYCGVGDSIPQDLLALKRVTGVVERPGFDDTIREARRLFPAADKLLVVGEPGLLFEANRKLLRSDLEAFAPDLRVEYLADMDIVSIERRLGQLEPGWLVFTVGRPEEGGKVMYQTDAATRITRASPVPVFVVWRSWMGHGPVGGKIIVPEDQGTAAAAIVAEIVRGRAAEHLPPRIEESGKYVFDYAALERFGLSESLLPAGALLLNKPVSFYETNRHLAWVWGLVTALLVVVCAGLTLYVAQRRRAQALLTIQANFTQSVMEAMPTPVFYKDAAGVYQGCNRAFEEFFRMSRKELIGRTVFDIYSPQEAAFFKQKDDELLAVQTPQRYEFDKASPNGVRQVMIQKAVYRDAVGKAVGLVGVFADITDLRRAEYEVKKTGNYLQAILDSSPLAIFCVDEDGTITHTNLKARELCAGRPMDRLQEALDRMDFLMDSVRDSITTGELHALPRQVAEAGGVLHAEDVVIYPLRDIGLREAVVCIDDVTERHRMQQLLVQSEKMMSVGGLAAGMAHEINNPLGGIMQSAQVVVNRMRTDLAANRREAEKVGCSLETIRAYLDARDIPELLENLRECAKRAADIVANMLEFSRRSSSAWLPMSVNTLVEKALELCLQDYNLSESFDFRKIAIVREFDPQNPSVPCSSQQIQQVLFNILRNAAQAMSKTTDPVITVRTGVEDDRVFIQVEDNGPGMDEATRRKVFEPFFTTKEPGLGTGLGMSVSYFIVRENHGGEIDVDSEPGKGARFMVKLPLKGRSRG